MNNEYERSLRRLPDYMVGGVRRYVADGIMPGDFLCAVFENNLHEAFARADDINRSYMWEYANMLHQAPRICWGSRKAMVEWHAHQGLKNQPWPSKEPAPTEAELHGDNPGEDSDEESGN